MDSGPQLIWNSELLVTVVFWLCLAGILYSYVGYPVLAALLSAAFGRDRPRPRPDAGRMPFVSLLIAAHNEERVIAERINDALALEYPSDRIEIVVASDGSTDRTVAIVKAIADSRVRLVAFHTRRGKTRLLNEVIPTLAGEMVILSDANTSIDPSAVRRFVDWFSDAAVGVVVGRLILTDPAHGRNVDSLYWRYETFLKRCEARLGALLGANGAIYALRRSLFAPIPDDTLLDDFVLPLLVKLRTRAEIVYDTEIVAFEQTPAEIASEFRRRSRIGAGGAQSLTILWPLLSPTRGWIAFTFVSHKVLRWSVPFLLVGAVMSSALLFEHRFYRWALAAQGLFYVASAVGAVIPGVGSPARLLRLITLFTAMNGALLSGFCRWLIGGRSGIWEPTVRDAADSLDRPAAADRPITVVHLVIALEIGGLEVVVANLVRHASRGFRLHVLCLEGLGPVAPRLGVSTVSVECIGAADTPVAQSVIRLRRRLRQIRPDVLHTHNEKAHIHGALAMLGWANRPALIHTRHGRTRVAGWKARLANRFAVQRSAFLVSVSKDASGIALAEGAAPGRMRVIRNGIDIGPYDRRGYGDRLAATRAVAISRLTAVKDIATILRAARIATNANPHFHLDIIGDGPSRLELEALRGELGLEHQVSFHGATDNVKPFLAAAGIFVQSSISEGISLTLLEAMAAGLPIVATRVGGNCEVVEEAVTGFLVPPRDPGLLAEAILRVMNDDQLAWSMSCAARQRAELHFNLRQMISGYETLYQHSLARESFAAAAQISGEVS